MIFAALLEAAQRNELILINGGVCRWHLTEKDQRITIREIISIRPGAGTEMLNQLLKHPVAKGIIAKCPVQYKSNEWWRKKGFELTITQNGINTWYYPLR